MEETFYKYLEFERRSSNHTLISYKTDLDQFKKFYNNLSNSEEIANADKRSIRSWIIDLSLNMLVAYMSPQIFELRVVYAKCKV